MDEGQGLADRAADGRFYTLFIILVPLSTLLAYGTVYELPAAVALKERRCVMPHTPWCSDCYQCMVYLYYGALAWALSENAAWLTCYSILTGFIR
ncbi:hypothetical protein MRX96_020193 [Rhipicephalus microplus]